MRRAAFAVLLASLAAAGASAQEDERVAAIARDLESPDLKTAWQGIRRLAELGEPALPALQKLSQDRSGRVRDYLDVAADEIRAARLFPGLPPLRRVTMKSVDRNVIELLGELRTKTGAAISLENLMEEEKLPEIPVDVADVTMLEAFDSICRAGNVSIMMENGQFALYPGDYVEMPRFFHGHYFFRLQHFTLLKSVDFRRPAAETFTLGLEMLFDPAAAPCKYSPAVVQEARDEKGKALIPVPAREKRAGEDDGQEAYEGYSQVRLLPPTAGAEKIAVLRGYSTIGLPRTRTVLLYDNPAEGDLRKADGFTLKCAKLDPARMQITLELASATLKGEALEELPVRAAITLKGGESTQTFVSRNAAGDGVTLTISYQGIRTREVIVIRPDGQEPAPRKAGIERLEVSIVTSIQDRRVPFEFRDVKIK